MANKIVKNKKQYMLGKQGSLNSQAGDETALEALYTSTNGGSWTDNTGWASSGMDLSNTIYGVTTETIDGELRVTEIDLLSNNLTGNINNDSLINLKKCRYLNICYNKITGQLSTFPSGLEYLYLANTDGYETTDPHEEAQTGSGSVHPGKGPPPVKNEFTGAFPDVSNLTSIKWIVCSYQKNLSSLPDSVFNLPSAEGIYFHAMENIATRSMPSTIGNMTNVTHLSYSSTQAGGGFLTGTIPSEFSTLTQLEHIYIETHSGTGLSGIPDLSNFTNLQRFIYTRNGISEPFPIYFADGRMPLGTLHLSWASDGGLTGTLPEFTSTVIKSINFPGGKMTGDIPASFWTTNTNLIVHNMGYHDFTGIGTDDLTMLTNIRNLRWYNNKISGRLPVLAWGTSALDGFTRFYVENNKYSFADLLWVPSQYNPDGKTAWQLAVDHMSGGQGTFTYDGQVVGDFASITSTPGTTVTLDNFSTDFTHADNVYQWQKDGSNLSDGGNISGATTDTLTITNIQSSDDGTYRLAVTNTHAQSPNMTIYSEEITINIS